MTQAETHSSPLVQDSCRDGAEPSAVSRTLTGVHTAACGKAIIVGEHAVVYGARAVAMPVHNLQMSVRLTPTARHDGRGAPVIRVLLGGRAVTAHLKGVVDDAFSALQIEPFALDLEGHSSVLIGAGLGSSASLCIVVLKALAAATGTALTPRQMAQFGNMLERRFHGNPSGLDTAVVAMGQVISFVKGERPETVPVRGVVSQHGAAPTSWRFALLDSQARSSTLAMIQVAAPYFQGSTGERRLALFETAALDVVCGLGRGDVGLVANAMARTGSWLAEAGLANPPIKELIDEAHAVGCLAAKPTGAGGGGCILALLHPEQAAQQLKSLKDRLGAARVFEVELPCQQVKN